MDLQLLLSSEQELPELLAYVRAYHEFEGIRLSEAKREEAVKALLGESEYGRIWLIKVRGDTVGYIVLCFGYSIEMAGRDAFIDEFFIDEAHRGRGVGRQVLEMVIAEAADLQIRALHLEVAEQNDYARNLYESLGFEPRERYVVMTRQAAG